ncbi:hypothetical protein LAZ67_4000685 [Cordylochernes scorpioides]|uniref:Major facilitator superfamily (MFS) profile domain-containing protein n=1 Tax=Cordylochernes scorpioides TaxID=51811 RepID=A0ABY6KEX0_9ARAC|nr:hypothetical protein LAZ67_4000685 [Cordylochernes scorpioides]
MSQSYNTSNDDVKLINQNQDFNKKKIVVDQEFLKEFEEVGLDVTPCKIDISKNLDDSDDVLPKTSIEEEKSRFDRPYAWLVVFACFISNFAVEGIAFSSGIFLTYFSEEFQMPKSSVSWIGSLLAGMYLIIGPIVGFMMSRFGTRNVAMFGGLLSALAFMFSSMSPHVSMLFVITSLIGGFGFGCVFLPTNVMIGHNFKRKLAMAAGIVSCGTGAGSIFIPLIANWMVERSGWRNAYIVLGSILLICIVCGIAYKPNNVEKDNKLKKIISYKDYKAEIDYHDNLNEPILLSDLNIQPDFEIDMEEGSEETDQENDGEHISADSKISTSLNDLYATLSILSDQVAHRSLLEHLSSLFSRKLLLNLQFLLLAFSSMLTCASGFTIFTYTADYATMSGINHSMAILFVPIIGVANTLGRVILGAISDNPRINPLHINNVGHIAGGIAIALWPLFTSQTGFLVNAIIFGLTMASFGSLRSVLTLKFLGLELFNDALSLQYMMQGIGTLLGPPLADNHSSQDFSRTIRKRHERLTDLVVLGTSQL